MEFVITYVQAKAEFPQETAALSPREGHRSDPLRLHREGTGAPGRDRPSEGVRP